MTYASRATDVYIQIDRQYCFQSQLGANYITGVAATTVASRP